MRFALAVCCLAGPAAASPLPVAAFDDPAHDASGPGSYVSPLDGDFIEGDFDLRRFTVTADGDEVIFEVTLGAPIRRPPSGRRTNETELALTNGIYLQNVDIYIDTGRNPGAGLSACIPGRRIGFAAGQTWDKAVVLTPQPGPARSVIGSALGGAAAHVLVVEPVESRGSTLVARVPVLALGGRPSKGWGYSVQVSGASWERSFAIGSRLSGSHEANAFTMDVLQVPEPYAFGGAPPGRSHTRVIDVLLPAGVDQRTALAAEGGDVARVPFVYGDRPGPAPKPPAARPPAASGLAVADVIEGMVSISGPVAGLEKLQFGRIVDAQGSTLARLVIVQVLEGGLLAEIVDGKEHVVRGARVVFDPRPSPSRSPR